MISILKIYTRFHVSTNLVTCRYCKILHPSITHSMTELLNEPVIEHMEINASSFHTVMMSVMNDNLFDFLNQEMQVSECLSCLTTSHTPSDVITKCRAYVTCLVLLLVTQLTLFSHQIDVSDKISKLTPMTTMKPHRVGGRSVNLGLSNVASKIRHWQTVFDELKISPVLLFGKGFYLIWNKLLNNFQIMGEVNVM